MFLRIGPTRISFEKQWQDDRSRKVSEYWSEALLELEQCSFSVLKKLASRTGQKPIPLQNCIETDSFGEEPKQWFSK